MNKWKTNAELAHILGICRVAESVDLVSVSAEDVLVAAAEVGVDLAG